MLNQHLDDVGPAGADGAIDSGDVGRLLSVKLIFAPRIASSRTISAWPRETGNSQRQAGFALAVFELDGGAGVERRNDLNRPVLMALSRSVGVFTVSPIRWMHVVSKF